MGELVDDVEHADPASIMERSRLRSGNRGGRTAAIAPRGALAQNLPCASLYAAIGEAALAHYADFGHCATNTLKAGQPIERLSDEVTEPVLLALIRMLVRATSWGRSSAVRTRPRIPRFHPVRGARPQPIRPSRAFP